MFSKNKRWPAEAPVSQWSLRTWFTRRSIGRDRQGGPTMCPKIHTYRQCAYVPKSSTRCYQQSHVESHAETH